MDKFTSKLKEVMKACKHYSANSWEVDTVILTNLKLKLKFIDLEEEVVKAWNQYSANLGEVYLVDLTKLLVMEVGIKCQTVISMLGLTNIAIVAKMYAT